MAKLVILGSAYSVPDDTHENTHMALMGKERMVLIDCVGTPILRLKEAGLDFNDITDIILTHFHPDHIGGVPLLLMNMWLLGRRRPLSIYGLHHTLDKMEQLMAFYEWSTWPNFFPVAFHRLPTRKRMTVLESAEFNIYAAPGDHYVPTIGIRIEFVRSEKVLVYSSDTKPCPEIAALAQDADVLIHEAAGAKPGHTSAAQAADLAQEANVKSLYLIHYVTETDGGDYAQLAKEAQDRFDGPVTLAEDFMVLEFD